MDCLRSLFQNIVPIMVHPKGAYLPTDVPFIDLPSMASFVQYAN